jgi:hypothetical protein
VYEQDGGGALGGEKERDMRWVGWDWVYVYMRVKNGIWLSAFIMSLVLLRILVALCS